MELRPAHCSVVRDINSYRFHDQNYMKSRRDTKERPVNIYEMHLGSFRKPSDKADDWYSYGEIADLLIPYLLESGYNYGVSVVSVTGTGINAVFIACPLLDIRESDLIKMPVIYFCHRILDSRDQKPYPPSRRRKHAEYRCLLTVMCP